MWQHALEVIGGTRNENWCIRVKATRIGSETAISQIVELVEAGQLAKAPVQKLVNQISMFFIPTSSRSIIKDLGHGRSPTLQIDSDPIALTLLKTVVAAMICEKGRRFSCCLEKVECVGWVSNTSSDK